MTTGRTEPHPAAGARDRELILYATPTGPLAEAVDRYEAAVRADLASTTAQTYPPHCTLTGFFRRDDAGAGTAIGEMGRAIVEAGPVPDGAVEVVDLLVTDHWVGLELRSSWLIDLTTTIAAGHRPGPDDDPLRPKDWLHLSLAYGVVDDLTAHARLARRLIDPRLEVGWEVGLWERNHDGSWTRHTDPPARTG